MKKILTISFLLLLFIVFQLCRESCAADLTKEDIMTELQVLKARMVRLEQALEEIEGTSSSPDKSAVNQTATELKVAPQDKVETTPKCTAENRIRETENNRILRQGERGVVGHWEALKKTGKPDKSTVEQTSSELKVAPEDKIETTTECTAENLLPEAEDNRILRQGERGVVGHLRALRETGEGLELSGSLEIEAGYEHLKPKHEKSEKSSFLELATVEIVIDAYLSNSLKAHIIFDYEEGEGVDIDEAMLHYQAEDVCQPDCSCNSPWFASLGRMTVPFGYYESHFITDPLTLVLGETQEVAALGGVHSGSFTLAAGVYNGDMDEEGKEDHIDNFVAAVFFQLDEKAIPDFALQTGISYISNIADSNELTDFFDDEFGVDTVMDRVDGISAFLSLSFKEMFSLEAEWVSALDKFKEDQRFEPKAWNLELAVRLLENMEIGLRYGGSEDALNFLPETQFGVIAAYEIFENTSIGFEYLYEEFDNKDKINRITTQLGVEF